MFATILKRPIIALLNIRPVVLIMKKAMSKLPVEFLESVLYRSILRTKFPSLYASKQISRRENVWDYSLSVVGVDKKILFLEFGVHEGSSLAYFSSKIKNANSKLYGFDSFEGLPEKWGNKPVGKFSTKGVVPTVEDNRVSFVKGWFQDTLPSLNISALGFDAVLVHMDADLYSSTLFVLSQLWLKFNVVFVIFDEFINHEARALYNFVQSHPCSIEFLAYDYLLPARVVCKIIKSPGTNSIFVSSSRSSQAHE